MSINAQKRTRSQRVASLEVRGGGWLSGVARLRDQGGFPRLGMCLLGAIVTWLVTEPWQTPFPYRIGETPSRDIVASVAFADTDLAATRAAQDQAARQVPFLFRHDPQSLQQLPEQLRNILTQLAASQNTPPPAWDDFLPLPNMGVQPVTPAERERQFQQFRQGLSNEVALEKLVTIVSDALVPYQRRGILDPELMPKIPRSQENQHRRDIVTVVPAEATPPADAANRATPASPAEVTLPIDKKLWVTVPVADLQLGDNNLREDLSAKADTINTADHLFYWLLRHLPKSTLTFDPALTQREKEGARKAVADVVTRYEQGGPLVYKGSTLNSDDIKLLRREHTAVNAMMSADQRALRALAWLGMIMALYAVCGYYVVYHEPRLWQSTSNLALLLLFVAVTVAATRWLSGDEWRAEIIPLLLFGMTIAIAYRQEVALLLSMVLCVLLIFAIGRSLGECVVMLAVTACCIFMVNRIRSRAKLIKVGLGASLIVFGLTLIVGVVNEQPLNWLIVEGGRNAGWVVVAGFLMSGALPFLESQLGVVTDISLLELGDVSHPLLQELVRRAPGTYNHSINVACIAEAAAESIGANGLLVRVGAYFHDIGKMLKPDYFIENQSPDANRHDTLVPAMSTLIIIAHVKDGADLARQHNLPQGIIDFIEQHHGTTLVQYFYNRQKEVSRDCVVEESAFRYPGPKPQTKEAGVLMLADAVESASRVLAEPTATRIRNLVHDISLKRLMDGQFDESGLNLTELKSIEDSLVKSLIAVYHGRVKYQDSKTEHHRAVKVINVVPEKLTAEKAAEKNGAEKTGAEKAAG